MQNTWPVSNKKFDEHVNDTNLHYSGLPIGSVIWWSGIAANRPAGFLLLDGSTYDTTLYSELYAILGTNVLPNYIGRFVKGSRESGVSEEAGLPGITGTFSGIGQFYGSYPPTLTGSFYLVNDENNPPEGVKIGQSSTAEKDDVFGFNASSGTVDTDGNFIDQEDSPYGKSNTVTPENISAVPLIKAKHYASVYEPGSLDETLRTEHNALKDIVNELQQQLASVRQNFIGLPDYNNPIAITALPYTCPGDGVVIANPNWTGGGASLFVYMTPKNADVTVKYAWLIQNNTSESGQRSAGQLIVREGDVISSSRSIGSFIQLNFFHFKRIE